MLDNWAMDGVETITTQIEELKDLNSKLKIGNTISCILSSVIFYTPLSCKYSFTNFLYVTAAALRGLYFSSANVYDQCVVRR